MSSHETIASSTTQSDADGVELRLIKPGPTSSRPGVATQRHSENELLKTITTKTTEEEAEKTRRKLFELYGHDEDLSSKQHSGVVFKHLTVRGRGLGKEYQHEVLDPVYDLWQWLKQVCAGIQHVERTTTLLNDFSGIIKPGQMLLVLGRPSAGCSTFLKSIGNQRHGYADVSGKLTYGGVRYKTMASKYSNEILYSGEEDLHYPTLTVRETLEFALKTRQPKSPSRFRKRDRSNHTRDYLRLIVRVFWLEHALDTIVGNEFIRGVSGGEKKRVR